MNIRFDKIENTLAFQDKKLTNAEIGQLLVVISEYLLNTHNLTIQSRIKQTLATSFTMVFPETQKFCKSDCYQTYGVSLGLFVESSQTAYNIHQHGNKSDS